MKQFNQQKAELDRELKRLTKALDELLPLYSQLLAKKQLSDLELKQLGEVEHYLIDVNAQICQLKERLENDLFGHAMDIFYKLKREARNGDLDSNNKLQKMREVFQDQIKGGNFINWN